MNRDREVAGGGFVLVHGGALGAWIWEPVIPLLKGTVVAVDLPPKAIRGVRRPDSIPPDISTVNLTDFADAVMREADAAGVERFVLVGHSMGGLTITEVARRIPDRVSHLVFVSAAIPPEGGNFIDTLPPDRRESARETVRMSLEGLVITDELAETLFCNDMSAAQTRFVLDHVGLEVTPPWTDPVTRAGLPVSLPVTYVRLLRDQCLSPDGQDQQIENLRRSPGCTVSVVEVDAGHNVMISDPNALAAVLQPLTT